MINHLTGFKNKYVLAFDRDNHLETTSSVNQKTLTLIFSVSRMTNFLAIIPYRSLVRYIVMKKFLHDYMYMDLLNELATFFSYQINVSKFQ